MKRLKQEEEMMQSLKLDQTHWFQFLDSMGLVLLQVLHLHHIKNQDLATVLRALCLLEKNRLDKPQVVYLS